MKRIIPIGIIFLGVFFLFSCEPMEGDYTIESPFPSHDIYTYMYFNPFFPQSVIIPRDFFNEGNRGTRWFDSYEDMNDYFRELYKDILPEEPEAPKGKET